MPPTKLNHMNASPGSRETGEEEGRHSLKSKKLTRKTTPTPIPITWIRSLLNLNGIFDKKTSHTQANTIPESRATVVASAPTNSPRLLMTADPAPASEKLMICAPLTRASPTSNSKARPVCTSVSSTPSN